MKPFKATHPLATTATTTATAQLRSFIPNGESEVY
jgi:hypothetical protein